MYDALIVKAAQKSEAARIVTFNMNDFKRVWPEGGGSYHCPMIVLNCFGKRQNPFTSFPPAFPIFS